MTTTIDSTTARAEMTAELVERGALRSADWIDAFRAVPREPFVPRFDLGGRDYSPTDPEYTQAVYTDDSLTTLRDEHGKAISSSSQPSTMARMLEAFTDGDAGTVTGPVLEIGTGTGYNTAVLCHRYGDDHVVSVDIDATLTDRARQALNGIGYTPTIHTGDGTLTNDPGSWFAGILATCGVDRIPGAWLQQLEPGGVLVTNIGHGIVRLVMGEDGRAEGGFLPEEAGFMRARPSATHVQVPTSHHAGPILAGEGTSYRTQVPTLGAPAEGPAEAAQMREIALSTCLEVSLLQHDVRGLLFGSEEDGSVIVGLSHLPSSSWARAALHENGTVEVTYQGRDLWRERIALLTGWAHAGRPSPEAYRLAAHRDGTHTLIRSNDQQWVF